MKLKVGEKYLLLTDDGGDDILVEYTLTKINKNEIKFNEDIYKIIENHSFYIELESYSDVFHSPLVHQLFKTKKDFYRFEYLNHKENRKEEQKKEKYFYNLWKSELKKEKENKQ